MSDEAAELLGQTLADAINAQGDAISAALQSAITSSMADAVAAFIGLLIVAGIVSIAMIMKDSEGNRDPILFLMAGMGIIVYAISIFDPTIAQNVHFNAILVAIVGMYLAVKAAVFAFSKGRDSDGG
ncbi:MAG: hypothetical protein ACRKGH_09680 [Dehalogenimonas sp.]